MIPRIIPIKIANWAVSEYSLAKSWPKPVIAVRKQQHNVLQNYNALISKCIKESRDLCSVFGHHNLVERCGLISE